VSDYIYCENCGQLTRVDEICPICSGPGDRLEIISSVEDMLPDTGLIAEMMAECR